MAADKSSGGRSPMRLVGRERELGMLREQLRRTLDGHGRLVLVSGEAGIGKTTLVERLTVEAEACGCLALWGHAYDLSTTPAYGPWLELLRGIPADTEGLPPLPDFVHDTRSLADIGSQDALFAAIASFFENVAIERPVVLVLDDLHWADQGSLDFLRFLARQIGAARMLLVATYRSDELHRHHPLYALLPLVIREADAERLEVRRLDANGHRSLLAGRYELREDDAARLQGYLETHAEGNPLFALELLRSLEEDAILRPENDGWALGDVGSVRLPPLLRQVIERRLDRLDDEARLLLQVAAIIGQEAPIDLWQRVTGASDEALAAAIEQGQATHLLREIPGGASYRFQHALLREALYEGMIALRRRGWHRAVGEALAADPASSPDAVAHHFQRAGDVRTVAWLLESARRARMAFATPTAVERLETALALDEQQQGGASGLRGWLLAALASWGELLSHTNERLRLLDEATDIARQTRDDALLGLIEWLRAYTESNFSTPAAEALGDARDQIQALPPDERKRLFGFIYSVAGAPLDPDGPDMTCQIAGLQAQSGQYREALAVVERVRGQHARLSVAAALGIDNALMASYQGLGRPDDALTYYERLLAAHRRDGVSDWTAVVQWLKLRDLILVYWPNSIALRHAAADDTVTAVRQAKAEQTFSQHVPDRAGIVWLLLLDGRWDDARQILGEAGDLWSSLMTAASWMVLSRHQGAPDVALARLPLVFPDGPASRPGRTTFETSVYCLHPAIEIALDAGDLNTARAWLDCHDRWMAWSGHVPFTTLGHLLWARYHRVAGDPVAARERAEQALALATAPRQPLAQLAAERFLGELDTQRGAHNSAQQHLTAALALADACQAPFERALTLAAMAELAVAVGKRDAARARVAEARAICEPLGAAPTLTRLSELGARLTAATSAKPCYPAGLSAREVEVLQLVSQGLTDAEVAEQLFLSPRTVGQHLRSVYNKLDVNSRAAATRFAVEHDLV